MSRYASLALIFSLLAVAASAWIGAHIFENLPHIEDEMAFVWQAEAIEEAGAIKLPSPPCPSCFLVPFVVDYHGERFGKYPPGWPVILAAGIRLGIRNLVNPLLAGLGVWLTFRLGKKLLGNWVGILAAFLTLASPFFLMESSSLLSHPLTLVLTLTLTLSWLDTFWPAETNAGTILPLQPWYKRRAPPWLTALVAALSLGVLALTRPLTAVGVGLPFAIHGLTLLWRGPRRARRLVLLVGLLALLVSLLFFLWQFALTGNALLNPYILWWPYDKVGFGPGIGVAPNGNDLPHAITNIYVSIKTGASDLFGWGMFSWIFLPFGIWAIRRCQRAWLVGSIFPSLVLVYTTYWISSWLLGPRYYYEGLFSLTILSAAGISWLAGLPIGSGENFTRVLISVSDLHFRKPDFSALRNLYRPFSAIALVILLIAVSVFYYDPARIGGLKGLYGVSRSQILPFLTPQAATSTPALVVVYPQSSWIEYGALLDLETPMLNTPFIFIINNNPVLNQQAIAAFPGRKVIDYYPDQPYTFFYPAH
jgi:hypothetical protein